MKVDGLAVLSVPAAEGVVAKNQKMAFELEFSIVLHRRPTHGRAYCIGIIVPTQ
jgi:hypothetical protein